MDYTEVDAKVTSDSYNYLSHPAFQVFTVIGLLYISTKIFSFLQLLASIFVLPGTNVSLL